MRALKALFVTTHTADIHNLVDAWNSFSPIPADHVVFNYEEYPLDDFILESANDVLPEIVFYIGGCSGLGLPSVNTFRALRKIAPLVNLVPDAADPPWHELIDEYRGRDCFDLHVGLDGCPGSPVDHVTITPVNPAPFEAKFRKTVRCGMSGSIGGRRDGILDALGELCTVRRRSRECDYSEYAHFLGGCRIVLNTAWTGSGKRLHVKGRVVETGWARSALLEHVDSPTKNWFPGDAYFTYADGEEARNVVMNASWTSIEKSAGKMAAIVRERYRPETIYGGILKRLFA